MFPLFNVFGSFIVDDGSLDPNASNRCLVVDSSGILHTIYKNSSGYLNYSNSGDFGVTWNNYSIINESIDHFEMAVDGYDYLWVVYNVESANVSEDEDIYYRRSTDSGSSWSSAYKLWNTDNTKSQSTTGLSIVVDNDNDVNVVMSITDVYTDGYVKARRWTDDTGSWSSTFTVTDYYAYDTPIRHVNCVVASNDTVFVFYEIRNSNQYDLVGQYFDESLNIYPTGSDYFYVYNDVSDGAIDAQCLGSDCCIGLDNIIHIVYRREQHPSPRASLNYIPFYLSNMTVGTDETVYYDSDYPVLSCSISWTYEGDVITLFSKHNVWTSTDKIHKRIRDYNDGWGDVMMMNQGNDNETEYPKLMYQRYPSTWIFTSGFIFDFFNDTTDKVCYAASNTHTWYDGTDYNPGEDPWNPPDSDPNGTGNHITFNVYNESNTSETPVFNIFVTNQSGSETYYDETCTSPYNCYYNLIPTGNKISFLISSAGYYSRQFYMDIDTSVNYEVNVYLAPYTANLYFMNVINEYNEPVEDVLLVVKRYINDTGRYENMTSLYTDGAGQCSAYLLPGIQYKVFLNKSGYYDKTEDYIPDPNYYGISYPKYFKIYFKDTSYDNATIYWECITFNGYVSGTTLYVNFTDVCNETIDTHIIVYEINRSTGDKTVFGYDNKTANYSFQTSFADINTSNCYLVVLNLNHTYFDFYRDSFLWCGIITLTNKSFFDNLFNLNYGTSPGGFGWSNIFGFIILVSGMFAFGQQGSGIAMVVTGGLLIFINSYIGLTVISILASMILIVFGVLVVWANQRRSFG